MSMDGLYYDTPEDDEDENVGGTGYCPYTPDRVCKTSKGGFEDDDECRECGWRAW